MDNNYGKVTESVTGKPVCWVPSDSVVESFLRANKAKEEYYEVATRYYNMLIRKEEENGLPSSVAAIRNRANALSGDVLD